MPPRVRSAATSRGALPQSKPTSSDLERDDRREPRARLDSRRCWKLPAIPQVGLRPGEQTGRLSERTVRPKACRATAGAATRHQQEALMFRTQRAEKRVKSTMQLTSPGRRRSNLEDEVVAGVGGRPGTRASVPRPAGGNARCTAGRGAGTVFRNLAIDCLWHSVAVVLCFRGAEVGFGVEESLWPRVDQRPGSACVHRGGSGRRRVRRVASSFARLSWKPESVGRPVVAAVPL